jgi:hypothetical protein
MAMGLPEPIQSKLIRTPVRVGRPAFPGGVMVELLAGHLEEDAGLAGPAARINLKGGPLEKAADVQSH